MVAEFLHGVEVLEVADQSRPIQTVKSSVIGLVGTAPKGPVNEPVLISGSRADGVKAFGAGLGTIPAALDAIFDQVGAAVVVVNVLDPKSHKVAVAAKEYTLGADDTVQLDHRYAFNLVVTYGALFASTATLGTDYTYDPDTGILTRVATGAITAKSDIKVGYDRPDPTAVAATDVAGGVTAGTGAYTGVHALLGASSAVKATPRILIAPEWTGKVTKTGQSIDGAPVTAEMVGIADRLKGIIVADGPNTDDADCDFLPGAVRVQARFMRSTPG